MTSVWSKPIDTFSKIWHSLPSYSSWNIDSLWLLGHLAFLVFLLSHWSPSIYLLYLTFQCWNSGVSQGSILVLSPPFSTLLSLCTLLSLSPSLSYPPPLLTSCILSFSILSPKAKNNILWEHTFILHLPIVLHSLLPYTHFVLCIYIVCLASVGIWVCVHSLKPYIVVSYINISLYLLTVCSLSVGSPSALFSTMPSKVPWEQ